MGFHRITPYKVADLRTNERSRRMLDHQSDAPAAAYCLIGAIVLVFIIAAVHSLVPTWTTAGG
jgi:hypothetical protein